MKKMLYMLFLILLSHTLLAPSVPNPVMYVPEPRIISYIDDYDTLIDAIDWYESKRIDTAFNEKEGARGRLQIRPCRVEHYNTLTGKNYTYEDMFDFNKSREVFLYFTNHDGRGRSIPNKSFEKAAKDWNGSGPMTDVYWTNITIIMDKYKT